jgi:hypothetical protein
MIILTPHLTKAIEIAAACIERELQVRHRLDPNIEAEELWAGVTLDGRILVGHPVLRRGQGVYVNHMGEWQEV